MPSLENTSFTKALLFSLLLLPAGCLLWKWSTLPTQILLCFSRGGNTHGDKHVLLLLVLLPLALYIFVSMAYRPGTKAASYRPLVTGVAVLLRLVLSTLIFSSVSGS